jgi:hypothetical protein
MKKTAIYTMLGMIIILSMTLLMIRFFFPNERASSTRLTAQCQFLTIRNGLLVDLKFWDGSNDGANWFANIDLKKASCGRDLVVTESKIFDITGAEIVLKTSSEGRRYLQRVAGPDSEFIPLSEGHDKFEFKQQ